MRFDCDQVDVERYQRTGFCTVGPVLDSTEVGDLLSASERVLMQADGMTSSNSVFNLEAPEGGYHIQDGVGSGYPGVVRKVNNPVDLDEAFRCVANRMTSSGLPALLLERPAANLMTSILWCKPARLGSEKPLHQDAPFLAPPYDDYVTLWLALDPARLSNGCLQFVPKSHNEGLLPTQGAERLVADDDYRRRIVPCELTPGNVVAFHPCTLHCSAANHSTQPRRSLMLRYRATAPEADIASPRHRLAS